MNGEASCEMYTAQVRMDATFWVREAVVIITERPKNTPGERPRLILPSQNRVVVFLPRELLESLWRWARPKGEGCAKMSKFFFPVLTTARMRHAMTYIVGCFDLHL